MQLDVADEELDEKGDDSPDGQRERQMRRAEARARKERRRARREHKRARHTHGEGPPEERYYIQVTICLYSCHLPSVL